MKRLWILLLAFAALAAPARGAEIAVALTEDVVEVDAGFSGARIVLFGALPGVEDGDPLRPAAHDIVAVVRGPLADFRVRPMQREGPIWTKGPAADIKGAPSILLTSATRPLADFATPALRRELMLDVESLDLRAMLVPAGPAAAAMIGGAGANSLIEAFLDHGREGRRYGERADAVAMRRGALFSIDIELPPTTPLGEYSVDVYLIADAEVVSSDTARLVVSKVGLERRIYELAHDRPIAYGIGCVVIALFSGWLAAAAFRK